MKLLKFLLLNFLLTLPQIVFSQDCVNYWKFNQLQSSTYNYFLVPQGCFSKLISPQEQIEIVFDLIQARDYKITIGSEYMKGKPIIKIYNIEDNILLYDNTTLDTINIIEFEIDFSRKVKAIITLPTDGTKTKIDNNIYDKNVLTPKVLRYCTGIKIETMITRK